MRRRRPVRPARTSAACCHRRHLQCRSQAGQACCRFEGHHRWQRQRLIQGMQRSGPRCQLPAQAWRAQATGRRGTVTVTVTVTCQRVCQGLPPEQQHTCGSSAAVATLTAAASAAAATSASAGAGATATSDARELAALPAGPTHPGHSDDVQLCWRNALARGCT